MDDITPPQKAANKQTPNTKIPPLKAELEPTSTAMPAEPTDTAVGTETAPKPITELPNKGPGAEIIDMPADTPPIKPAPHVTKPSVPPHKRLKWIFFKPEHMSRKKWLIIDSALLVVVIVAALGIYALYRHLTQLPPLPKTRAVKQVPKPTTVPSRLTGLDTSPDLNNRPITGVMIENSPDARPQSGLLDAGVVYEAIAEGGITRFLALYQEAQPDYIGPVRSARPYYLDFILPFQGALAHVGGSPEALQQINALHVRNLDEFANAAAYKRISTRFAPHNVYTSSSSLDAVERKNGYTTSTFTGFPRKKDSPLKTATASKIDFSVSSFLYNAHYDYDPSTNTYKRSEGGKPHTDEKSQKQLAPKVVIAVVMSYAIESDGKHSQYGTTGSGNAYVFQDGGVTKGKWSKASRTDQITFTDTQGQTIKLNAGQTWISLVASDSAVSYK